MNFFGIKINVEAHGRASNVHLHEYVVMPNHFHAIIEIVGATLVVAQNSMVTQNEIGQPQGLPLHNEKSKKME